MASRRRLLIRLGTVREQIADIEATYDKLNSGDRAGVAEYETTTSNDIGKQRTKYRSPREIMDQLEILYSREDSILNALNGRGVVNVNLRRRSCGNNR